MAREAQFVVNIDAFMRYDFYVIDHSMRTDVILKMPGTSRFAGVHEGIPEVGRCLAGLRHALRPERQDIKFQHKANQMTVTHGLRVVGPRETAEMAIRTHVFFDEDGQMSMIQVEPEDIALFDETLNTVLSP